MTIYAFLLYNKKNSEGGEAMAGVLYNPQNGKVYALDYLNLPLIMNKNSWACRSKLAQGWAFCDEINQEDLINKDGEWYLPENKIEKK